MSEKKRRRHEAADKHGTRDKTAASAPAGAWGAAGAAARTAVALVFLVSGLHKAAAPPEEFAVVLEAYYILPPRYIPPLSAGIPRLEILLGLALLCGFAARHASAVAGGLLLAFIAALASTLYRGVPLENCGCFGGGIHLTPAQAIGLDSALVCLAYCAYRYGSSFAPLDAWIARGRETPYGPET